MCLIVAVWQCACIIMLRVFVFDSSSIGICLCAVGNLSAVIAAAVLALLACVLRF